MRLKAVLKYLTHRATSAAATFTNLFTFIAHLTKTNFTFLFGIFFFKFF